MRRPTAVVSIALALAAGGLTACGGKGSGKDPAPSTSAASAPTATPPGQEGKPVTEDQAVVLARLLLRNHDDGGAHVTGDFPFTKQARVLVDGQVDWRHLRGTMTVREPTASPDSARRYFWTKGEVLAQARPGSEQFQVSKPDPDNQPAHFLISALALLSAETLDNVALIRDQGSRYLGRKQLEGRPTDVYQYGTGGKNEYWVDASSGVLQRIVLDLPQLGGSGTLDFDQRGPKDIELPPKADRVAA